MNRILYTLFLVVVLAADSFSAIVPTHYFISFRDKNNNPYSVSQPQAFLSARSIARRERQNISTTTIDLPVTPAYIDSVKAKGAAVLYSSKWLNGVVVYTKSVAVLTAISHLSFVKKITEVADSLGNTLIKNGMSESKEKNKMEEVFKPINQEKNAASEPYGFGTTQIKMLNGDYLHQKNFKGKGMWIALLDAGFNNLNHIASLADLFTSGRIISTYNFPAGNDSVYTILAGHGTSVLSTMAANIPNQFVGTAPEASFILFRSEIGASEQLIEEYYWTVAAERADSMGVDVINSSLGYNEFDDATQNHTHADMNGNTAPASIAASIAAAKGMLVVISAGNEGMTSWKYIGTPADAINNITVGAVYDNRIPAEFSSYGYSADARVKPDVAAMGAHATVMDNAGNIMQSNGTSFSSPILCGLAACLWQKHQDKTALEIREAIIKSCSQYTMPDDREGYGIPDFQLADVLLSQNVGAIYDKSNYPLLYPNPYTDESVIFTYSKFNQQAVCTVFNSVGQQLFSEKYTTYQNTFAKLEMSDMRKYSGGLYFVHVEINNQKYFVEMNVVR